MRCSRVVRDIRSASAAREEHATLPSGVGARRSRSCCIS